MLMSPLWSRPGEPGGGDASPSAVAPTRRRSREAGVKILTTRLAGCDRDHPGGDLWLRVAEPDVSARSRPES